MYDETDLIQAHVHNLSSLPMGIDMANVELY